MKNLVKSFLLVSVISLVFAQPALAYIDPNTGGMLFQLLAVIFASLSAIFLIFSRQIRMLFARASRALRGLFGARSEPAETEDHTASESPQQSTTPAEPPDRDSD